MPSHLHTLQINQIYLSPRHISRATSLVSNRSRKSFQLDIRKILNGGLSITQSGQKVSDSAQGIIEGFVF